MVVLVPLVYLFALRQHAPWADGVRFAALIHQIRSFSLGLLDLRHLALHFSVCVFMLFLTVKVVESRVNQ
jgi:hypothetical protein